jgi:hypothetical protein
MLTVGGASAIPAEQHFAATTERPDDNVCRCDNRVSARLSRFPLDVSTLA